MIALAVHSSFWASTLALVLTASVCGLLVAIAMVVVMMRHLRGRTVSERVGQFTSLEEAIGASPPTAVTSILNAREWADRLFEGHSWWHAFKEKLELARIEQPASKVILVTVLATLLGAVSVSLLTGAPALIIPMLAFGPGVTLAIVNQRLARQRMLFSEQLPAHLQELASAMRAGHSLVRGLRTIAESAAEPMRGELERVLADEQLGVPLDVAFMPVARRMACDDINQVALVASLHQHTGGNMAPVIDQVAESARERGELRRELSALTAQARLSRWVVTLLPLGLLVIIAALNSSYLTPLFHTSTGVLMLFVATILVIAGSLIMKRIVSVEA